jgi:hypothetical protein
MSYASPSVKAEYIYGTPSRHFDEAVADSCLSFPRATWGRANVELLQRENNYDARYSHAGCIRETFQNTMDCLLLDRTSMIVIPGLMFTIVAYGVTSLAALPFEMLGTCMKISALEMNPTAKTYNQMAINHLEILLNNDVTLEKIEILRTELKNVRSKLTFQKGIYDLLLGVTKHHPKNNVEAKLGIGSIPDGIGEIDFVIHPIMENDCIIDYKIAAPFKSISGFPTTRSALSNRVKSMENEIHELEKQIIAKEKHLEMIQNAPKKFANDVKELLHQEINEASSLI